MSKNAEEIPLLSADERRAAAGTSFDRDPPATSTRQRTNAGTGDRAADKGQALRRKGGEFAAQAEHDVKGVVNIAQKGVASGTWLYPIRGVVYLLTRKSQLSSEARS